MEGAFNPLERGCYLSKGRCQPGGGKHSVTRGLIVCLLQEQTKYHCKIMQACNVSFIYTNCMLVTICRNYYSQKIVWYLTFKIYSARKYNLKACEGVGNGVINIKVTKCLMSRSVAQ